MKQIYLAGIFLILGILLPTTFLQAATLYIDPGVATLGRGDTITTSVRIMPDQAAGECINAADIVISYPASIQPVDVSIGRSIFSVWVEDPVINKENRTITLAGGIPNGYCGRVQGDPGMTNVIADIIFRSPGFQVGVANSADDKVDISFTPETQVYLNDGQGTKADLATISSTLELTSTPSPEGIVDDWRTAVREDKLPPEKFSILLERDPIAFSGKYFIVFSTTDKQTGLSHYEVMEEPLAQKEKFNWGSVNAPWEKAVSPYTLKDQSLNSTIRVRAVDKAGNEYIATLIPEESLRSALPNDYSLYLAGGLGLLFVILLFALVFFMMRRRKGKQTEITLADEDADSKESKII